MNGANTVDDKRYEQPYTPDGHSGPYFSPLVGLICVVCNDCRRYDNVW